MRPIRELDIGQDHVAVLASGPSMAAMDPAELAYVRQRCFTVTLNYGPVALPGDLNVWSDRRVGEFLASHYAERPKDRLLAAQQNHMRGLEALVDFVFDRRSDGLSGSFTLVWILQILQRYAPDKTILLFGADHRVDETGAVKWYDAHTEHDRRHRGRGFDAPSRLAQCAAQLASFCRREGVINCTPGSALDVFERRDWRGVLPIRVAHLTSTPLAGAPAHLSRIINRYTPHRSTSVLRMDRWTGRKSNLWWDYDVHAPGEAALDAVIADADVLHLHGKPYPANLRAKPSLLQYHTPPGSYRPRVTHPEFNGRKLVIAQYHPRFYTDARIVPNLLDIWDPSWKPDAKDPARVRIFYSWATEVPGGWSDKGSRRTKAILERIASRYGADVEIVVKSDRPYAECMAAKRVADICIDECATGSYHLQSLEGCAVGAVTLNALDGVTAGFLAQACGAPDHPFTVVGLDALEATLCGLIEDRERLRSGQAAARNWMERWWDPRLRVHAFVMAYFDVLIHGELRQHAKELSTVPAPAARVRPPVTRARPGGGPAHRPPPVSRPGPASAPKPPPAVRARAPVSHVTTRFASRSADWRNPNMIGRPIAELHGRHRGREVCVVGCGPSLFRGPVIGDDAAVIAINFAFEHIARVDHHFVHTTGVLEAIAGTVDPSHLVLPETLVRPGFSGGHPPGRVAPEIPQALVYPIQDPNERSLARKNLSTAQDARMMTWTSAAHSAIHFAAYMGASRIRLIGMDCSPFPDGRVHFDTPLMQAYGAQTWNANRRHHQGIEWIISQLAHQDIIVSWESA